MSLMRRLVCHHYTTHVRELERLLWRALATSRVDRIELTEELLADLVPEGAPPKHLPTLGEVRAALERARGVRDRAWRDLGLANRWALNRLIKKYGLEERGADDDEGSDDPCGHATQRILIP